MNQQQLLSQKQKSDNNDSNSNNYLNQDPPQAKASQGGATYRDTESLFTISNDSYVEGEGPSTGQQKSHRSGQRGSQKDKHRKNSKTQRATANFEPKFGQGKKLIEIKNEQKPISARSNNLEIWLSKKRALDEQSKQSDRTKTMNKDNLQQNEQQQNVDRSQQSQDQEKDLSYLSKLQSSLFFEPGGTFKDKEQLVEKEAMKPVQKSDSQFNIKQIQKKEQEMKQGQREEDYQEKQKNQLETLIEVESKYMQSQANPMKSVFQSQQDSLLIFNPKEEAVTDQNYNHANMLSLTQSKMLKEAMLHVKSENQYLKDQILEQQELLEIHKKMISDILILSQEKIEGIHKSGQQLNQKLDDQGKYLMGNRGIIDNSQISFMTTDMDIHEMDIFRYEGKSKKNSRFVEEKSAHNNELGPCSKCQTIIDQERQEFKQKQADLLNEIETLKQDIATVMNQKELLMRSSLGQSNLGDNDNAQNTSRSQNPKSPSFVQQQSQDGGNNEMRFDNIEQALQPLLEQLTDPSNEVLFQDSKGRIYKITVCDDQGADLDDIQQNMEDMNLQQNEQQIPTEFEEEAKNEVEYYDGQPLISEESPEVDRKQHLFNSANKETNPSTNQSNRGSVNAFQNTAATNSHFASSGVYNGQNSVNKDTSSQQHQQQQVVKTEEEYYYDEEDDDNYDFRDFGAANNNIKDNIHSDKKNTDEEFNMLSDGDIDILNQI